MSLGIALESLEAALSLAMFVLISAKRFWTPSQCILRFHNEHQSAWETKQVFIEIIYPADLAMGFLMAPRMVGRVCHACGYWRQVSLVQLWGKGFKELSNEMCPYLLQSGMVGCSDKTCGFNNLTSGVSNFIANGGGFRTFRKTLNVIQENYVPCTNLSLPIEWKLQLSSCFEFGIPGN